MERPDNTNRGNREAEAHSSGRDPNAAFGEAVEAGWKENFRRPATDPAETRHRADATAASPERSKGGLLAYILPFVAFLVMTSVEQWEPIAKWYPAFYSAKIAIVLALWWAFRRRYPAVSAQSAGWGVLAGVVGVGAWIVLADMRLDAVLPEWLAAWFVGERAAYNPFEAIASSAGQWAFVVVRLVGLAVVVPLMEEVFWRGFLIRYVIDEDFERVPIGRMTAASFFLVTVLFAAVHPEVLAALVWGAGVNLLLYFTRSLWACIVAHATTNLLLGLYVVATGTWHLW